MAVGILALVVSGLLVAVLVQLLGGRSAPRPEPASAATPTTSATPVLAATPMPELEDPDDEAVPTKSSDRAAAGFVDAWLTKDPRRRLDRLRDVTVSSLYDGLTYTDPAEIPTARRVGSPRVEDVGSYLVRYRVDLSDRSQVLVSTVYDGTRWLVESVEPAVG